MKLSAINIPNRAVESFALNKNWVHICVSSWEKDLVFHTDCIDGAQFVFQDILEEKKELIGGEIVYGISGRQARDIVKFCEKYKNKNFLVNCDAGYSRSAAIVKFINLMYGHELRDNFENACHPNIFVLTELKKAANMWPYHLKPE